MNQNEFNFDDIVYFFDMEDELPVLKKGKVVFIGHVEPEPDANQSKMFNYYYALDVENESKPKVLEGLYCYASSADAINVFNENSSDLKLVLNFKE
jgi:hypothetical protein